MSAQDGPTVAAAAQAAGFAGDALVNIVAIGKRESGWDDTAQGDIGIQDSEWGPSVGVWQIRTLKAQTGTGQDRDIQALIPGATPGQPGSGRGDLGRQARAAWSISSAGTNFEPWSTWRGLSDADLAAARDAVANIAQGQATFSSTLGDIASGIGSAVAGDFAGAMDSALGAVLGYSGTFSEWAAMVIIRGLEVVGGGLCFAVGLVLFLDVIASGSGGGARAGARGIGGSLRTFAQLAKRAAVVAAA